MQAPLLSVRNLKVELPLQGEWRPAVAGVTFEVRSGESLGIVGESGCGKTLLARALVGLPPEGARVSGVALYRGRDLLSLSEREWEKVRGREIALIFQEPGAALDPVQTIGAQIAEALPGRPSGFGARARARQLLAEASFSDPERGVNEYPHRLSGGQRQRAFLAAALAGDPSILVADEPTTALDATVSAEVMELLEALRARRRLTLILITHDLATVARYTDRLLVLYAGRVVEEARTAELFRAPRHPYTRALLACAPRLDAAGARHSRLPTIAGSVPDLAFRPSGVCAFALRCPDRFAPCETREPECYEVGESRARCFLYEAGLASGGGSAAT